MSDVFAFQISKKYSHYTELLAPNMDTCNGYASLVWKYSKYILPYHIIKENGQWPNQTRLGHQSQTNMNNPIAFTTKQPRHF
jgi:hypothetical protein